MAIAFKILLGLILLGVLFYEQRHHWYKQHEGQKGVYQWACMSFMFLSIAILIETLVCVFL